MFWIIFPAIIAAIRLRQQPARENLVPRRQLGVLQFDTAPRHVIRARDSIHGEDVVATIRALGLEGKVIGGGDRHSRRVLRESIACCHGSRTRLGDLIAD